MSDDTVYRFRQPNVEPAGQKFPFHAEWTVWIAANGKPEGKPNKKTINNLRIVPNALTFDTSKPGRAA